MTIYTKVFKNDVFLNGNITALAISDSGRYVALGGDNGTVGVYCFEEKKTVCLMMIENQVNCVDWAGPTLLVGDAEGSLHLFL